MKEIGMSASKLNIFGWPDIIVNDDEYDFVHDAMCNSDPTYQQMRDYIIRDRTFHFEECTPKTSDFCMNPKSLATPTELTQHHTRLAADRMYDAFVNATKYVFSRDSVAHCLKSVVDLELLQVIGKRMHNSESVRTAVKNYEVSGRVRHRKMKNLEIKKTQRKNEALLLLSSSSSSSSSSATADMDHKKSTKKVKKEISGKYFKKKYNSINNNNKSAHDQSSFLSTTKKKDDRLLLLSNFEKYPFYDARKYHGIDGYCAEFILIENVFDILKINYCAVFESMFIYWRLALKYVLDHHRTEFKEFDEQIVLYCKWLFRDLVTECMDAV
jgi:hypothetical protein